MFTLKNELIITNYTSEREPPNHQFYNKSLLINFDRLAFDDGKGVGQSYMQKKKNNFHYRFGSYSRSEDI